jgi:hypothetical protein
VVVEGILRAVIRGENVVWVVVAGIDTLTSGVRVLLHTSVWWTSAVGVRRVERGDASSITVEATAVVYSVVAEVA